MITQEIIDVEWEDIIEEDINDKDIIESVVDKIVPESDNYTLNNIITGCINTFTISMSISFITGRIVGYILFG